MANKLRLGFIGANVRSVWASESHFPALRAHPDVELAAVCTTNAASAEESRLALGARLAFSDYREIVACPDIDAVSVVVRTPSHFEVTKAALEAGKSVYTEWPLGRTTEEAVELAALAKKQGVRTAVGLQSRAVPGLRWMRDLIQDGYVGEVLACSVSMVRNGPLARASYHNWDANADFGHTTLTVRGGHTIDAMRFVLGDFAELGGMVTTQVKQWHETDTGKMVDVTSPDNVLLSGRLNSGAVASVHVGSLPWATSGYRMEVYGREGTLVATAKASSNRDTLRLQGAQRSNELSDLVIPEERYTSLPKAFPRGTPFNVGQMYALFAEAVRTGRSPECLPTFDTAVEMHRLLDRIREAAGARRTLAVA